MSPRAHHAPNAARVGVPPLPAILSRCRTRSCSFPSRPSPAPRGVSCQSGLRPPGVAAPASPDRAHLLRVRAVVRLPGGGQDRTPQASVPPRRRRALEAASPCRRLHHGPIGLARARSARRCLTGYECPAFAWQPTRSLRRGRRRRPSVPPHLRLRPCPEPLPRSLAYRRLTARCDRGAATRNRHRSPSPTTPATTQPPPFWRSSARTPCCRRRLRRASLRPPGHESRVSRRSPGTAGTDRE